MPSAIDLLVVVRSELICLILAVGLLGCSNPLWSQKSRQELIDARQSEAEGNYKHGKSQYLDKLNTVPRLLSLGMAFHEGEAFGTCWWRIDRQAAMGV